MKKFKRLLVNLQQPIWYCESALWKLRCCWSLETWKLILTVGVVYKNKTVDMRVT